MDSFSSRSELVIFPGGRSC